MKYKFLLAVILFSILCGCNKSNELSSIKYPTLLKCENDKDRGLIKQYTQIFIDNGNIEFSDNYGGYNREGESIEIKKYEISESYIKIDYEEKFNGRTDFAAKKIAALINVNRFTGRFTIKEKYYYNDGSTKEFSGAGDCEIEIPIKRIP